MRNNGDGRLMAPRTRGDFMKRLIQSAVVLAFVASVIVAGPVAAATAPTSDYGNTVNCRYRAGGSGPAYDYVLKRLVVTPPVLYAVKGTQTVGWRFVVTRAEWWGSEPWKVTYRSPVQKRSATTTTARALPPKVVTGHFPNVETQKTRA